MVRGLVGVLGPAVCSPGQWLSTEGMHTPVHIVRDEIRAIHGTPPFLMIQEADW
jgi:hypothetical protein